MAKAESGRALRASRLSAVATAFVLLVGALGAASPAQAEPASQLVDAPNNSVRVVAVAPDGTQYVGGDFTSVGAATGGFASVTTTNAATVDRSWPSVTGAVNAVVSDGSGGWYIAGSFSKVGDQTRSNLARITSSGTVDPDFAPNVGGVVRAMVKVGSTVYFGGDFTSVGSTERRYAAAVDASTGTLNGWNPVLGNFVFSMAASDSTVYLGGQFTTAGGVTRNRAAAFTTYVSEGSPGSLTDWNPNLSNSVLTLALSGSTVYLGGQFSGANSVNGNTTRNRAAAVDATTGTVTDWNPNFSGNVRALAVSGSTVYAGGEFFGANSVNGNTTRNRAAAVDATTGTVTGWDPNLSALVRRIVVNGSTVYLGGAFNGANSVNGTTTRNRAAAVSAYSDQEAPGGTVTGWNPNVGGGTGNVYAIGVSGSTVALGGEFVVANQISRNRAAAFDSSGMVTDWNPNLNGAVAALSLSGSTVYLGGAFSGANSVNGTTTRNRAAAVDATTGTVTSWDPNFNGTVRAFAVSGSTVYVVGEFSGANSVNGNTTRNRAAAVDATTGSVMSWDPNFNGTARALAVSGSTVYVGGEFFGANSVNGNATRNRAAAVDATTGTVTDWNPNIAGTAGSGSSPGTSVYGLAVSGSTVYAVGDFNGANSVNGNTLRNRAAAFDATSGNVLAWNPNLSGVGYAIAVSGSSVYLGGFISTVNGSVSRNRAAAVAAYTDEASPGGTALSWNPGLDFSVFALATSGANVFLGGQFTATGSTNYPGRPYYSSTSGVNVSQTISFGALSSWSLGGGVRSVSASASSGLTVSFSSQTEAVCTVSGSSVSMVSVGTCTVRASQAGNGTYAAATPVDQSFTVTSNPAQASSMSRDGTTATWPAIGDATSYFVMYRQVGSGRPWGVYASGGSSPEVRLNNTVRRVCSPANTALGYTNCALPYGFVNGTRYEFAVYSRNAAGKTSLAPLGSLLTYTP